MTSTVIPIAVFLIVIYYRCHYHNRFMLPRMLDVGLSGCGSTKSNEIAGMTSKNSDASSVDTRKLLAQSVWLTQAHCYTHVLLRYIQSRDQ